MLGGGNNNIVNEWPIIVMKQAAPGFEVPVGLKNYIRYIRIVMHCERKTTNMQVAV